MDERKLAELMNDAVAETPPPTFDQNDVAHASERLRVRRRNSILAGSAASVAVLASASVLAVALWSGENSSGEATSAAGSASSSNGNAAPYEVPEEDSAADAQTERGDQSQDVPSEAPSRGGSSSGNAGPAGPGGTPSGCEQADRELAAALAGELPAAASYDRDAPQPVALQCPHGSIGAAFPIEEGQRAGVVSVVVVQPDLATPTWQLPTGAHRARATTPNGATVLVVTEPSAGATAPLAENLDAIAAGVAERY